MRFSSSALVMPQRFKGVGGDDREHVFTQSFKVFRSHWQLSLHAAIHPRSFSRIRLLQYGHSCGGGRRKIDDGLAHRRQAWLRRRSVDSFFSAPPVRGDGVARQRRRSWSLARGGISSRELNYPQIVRCARLRERNPCNHHDHVARHDG